jgi:hypothetical protein
MFDRANMVVACQRRNLSVMKERLYAVMLNAIAAEDGRCPVS